MSREVIMTGMVITQAQQHGLTFTKTYLAIATATDVQFAIETNGELQHHTNPQRYKSFTRWQRKTPIQYTNTYIWNLERW